MGTSDKQYVQSFPIAIKGVLRKDLTGRTNFRGFFALCGVTLPLPKASHELNVNLDSQHGSPMVYYYFDENHRPRTYSVGVLYANNDFSKFSILFTNSAEGWHAENGTMISAPASNRDEALNISNDLMSGAGIPNLTSTIVQSSLLI